MYPCGDRRSLRKDFNGKVQMEPISGGIHQSIIGDVLVFSTREVLVPITGLKPVTADKLQMDDVDVSFTYSVNPASIPLLYTKYSTTYNMEQDGEIYLMYDFVKAFVRASIADAIAKYPAMGVNDSRGAIASTVEADVNSRLRDEGLANAIHVHQIVLTNVSVPRSILASAQQVVTAQNQASAARYAADKKRITAHGDADAAVIRATGEAKAIAIQSQTIADAGGENYLRLEAIRKWDGSMPTYMGAGLPLPFIGKQ